MAEIGGILPLAAYEKDGEDGDDDIRIFNYLSQCFALFYPQQYANMQIYL